MENLIFNSDKKLDTTNFVRVGDLVHFEGPLLSLFEDVNSGHFFIFDWVDRNQKYNRWLIYRVSPKSLWQFLCGKISHLEVFKNKPSNDVYFSDIDYQSKTFSPYNTCKITVLPENYLPNNDNFFDSSDCNAFEKIKSAIIRSLSRQKSENEYSQLYSIGILKNNYGKSIYLNKVNNRLIYTQYPLIKKLESSNAKIETKTIHINIGHPNFTAYSNFKNLETNKGKEYANQYN